MLGGEIWLGKGNGGQTVGIPMFRASGEGGGMLQHATGSARYRGGRPLPGAMCNALEGCRCPNRRAGRE
eukprot:10161020-Lingulodinium_polyedra.AAC.1